MSPFVHILIPLAILGYAVVGGVFLAFSDFIMRSLSLAQGSGGVEVMQIVNREVFRWVFMALFLGMAAMSLLLAGYAATSLAGPARVLMLASALVYLAGCFAVTAVFNVPMNQALDGMELTSRATLAYWNGTYVPRWTAWNTVRTAACIASAALLLYALLWLPATQRP